jgi:hypothetical protein
VTGPEPLAGGNHITLLAVYDSGSCVGRCDAACYNASGPCRGCICGGANHGIGREQAISNTRRDAYLWLDRAIDANPAILAADIMTGPGEGLSEA